MPIPLMRGSSSRRRTKTMMHPPSLQGASVGKCRPLCENSVILGMEAIESPQADVDLLD